MAEPDERRGDARLDLQPLRITPRDIGTGERRAAAQIYFWILLADIGRR